MDAAPDASAADDFEFEALRWAENYRRALIAEFRPHLSGRLLEVGAGIGQMTELLVKVDGVKEVLAVEPEAKFTAEFRKRLPGNRHVPGTVADLEPGSRFDGIVSVNVLEHIREDDRELKVYAGLLEPSRGVLCLFVPARPEIYAALDRDFGHFRRYTKPGLRAKLESAGFEVLRLHYFNWIGYFGWWLNFRVLGKRHFDVASVKLFDRVIFPVGRFLESKVCRPPFGQSLLAVAKAKPVAG